MTSASEGELDTLLGRGTEFRGRLVFDGIVRIDGHFEGEVRSSGTLIVGDGAEVVAELWVGSLLVLGGLVRGNVRAKESVEVHAPAKLYGNVTAPQVFIDKGVVFEGLVKMKVPEPEEPPPQESVEPIS